MKYSEIKSTVKKGDLLVIFGALVICLLWFIIGTGEKENLTVTVYSGGEILYENRLGDIDGEETVTANGCEILITKEGALFRWADCPDGLCVKRGILKKDGDVMACVPEKVTVRISSDKSSIDGVAY